MHVRCLTLLAAVTVFGCGKSSPNDESMATPVAGKPGKSAVSRVPEAKLGSAETAPSQKPVSTRPANLNGKVFVAEYHHIRAGKGGMFRTPQAFIDDLNRFYKDGFRPVTVAEYVTGKMPIPPGSSPVVFTFDDANPTQYWIRKDGSVDPDCAIGIWQEFAKTHPDFPIKATQSSPGSAHPPCP